MAVKTEAQLIAECASGKPVTASLLTDVINTIFSRGGGSSESSVFVNVTQQSDTIQNILTSAGISLSGNALIVVSNNNGYTAEVTLYDNSGIYRGVSIPQESYVTVYFDGSQYYAQSSVIA